MIIKVISFNYLCSKSNFNIKSYKGTASRTELVLLYYGIYIIFIFNCSGDISVFPL